MRKYLVMTTMIAASLFIVASALGQDSLMTPLLLHPDDGATEGVLYGHVAPLLAWSPVMNASSYDLQIAYDSVGFNNPILDETIVDGTLTDHCRNDDDYVCQYIINIGDLRWRVRAHTDSDSSRWSEERSLTVVRLVSTEDASDAPQSYLSIYPIPFGESVNIIVSGHQQGFTSLQVYDILGRVVDTVYSNKTQSQVQLEWDTSSLSAGRYFFVLVDEDRNILEVVPASK